MNILVISPFYPPYIGGVEVIASEGAVALASRGHAVTVLTSSGPDRPSGVLIDSHGITIHRLGALHPHLPDESTAEELASYLSALIQERKFDVVHTHLLTYPWMPFRSRAIQACLHDHVVVDQAHGGDFEHRAEVCIDLMRSVKHLICDSEYVLQRTRKMIRNFSESDNEPHFAETFMSVLHPKLVDGRKFAPAVERRQELRRRFSIDRETFVVLYPSRFFDIDGNFSSRKRPLFALEAFASFLHRTRANALLLAIMPPGFLNRETEAAARQQLEQLIGQLGITRNILLLDTGIRHDQMPDIYPAADVTLVPSVEGFGLVLLESMACGVPVVTVSEGASSELLDNSAAAFVGNDDQVIPAISAALESFYADRSLVQRKGASAREKFLALFADKESWIEDLERLLKIHAGSQVESPDH